MNTGHTDRENKARTPYFDLNKVDYDWVEKCRSVKDLKAALKELEVDGYFPDLADKVRDKICTLDASFKRLHEGKKKLTLEEERAVNADVLDFLQDINKTDNALRNIGNEEIYPESAAGAANGSDHVSPLVERLENQKIAENERLKGNEAVKAKDFKEAVTCYSRSI
jgi:hypothetical protein